MWWQAQWQPAWFGVNESIPVKASAVCSFSHHCLCTIITHWKRQIRSLYYEESSFRFKKPLERTSSIHGKICEHFENHWAGLEGSIGISPWSSEEPSSTYIHKGHIPCQTSTVLEAEDTELNKKLSAFKELIISWDKQTEESNLE